jgi:hypothetical protein
MLVIRENHEREARKVSYNLVYKQTRKPHDLGWEGAHNF